jgi:hypothetical protein
MKRSVRATGVAAAAGILALCTAGAPAQATTQSGEPVVTHPVEQSFNYTAGEVCAFPAHVDFPVSDLTLRTWADSSGKPVFSIESGPLVMGVTNLANGKTVQRDISGTGTLTYPDPNSFILSGDNWSAGFHTTDRPMHNHWIVAYGYMSVKVTTVNGQTSRTLLALHGPYEDLCKTLA